MNKIAVICPIGKTGNVVPMTINWLLTDQYKLSHKDYAGKTKDLPAEMVVIVPHTLVSRYSDERGVKDQGLDSQGKPIISEKDNKDQILKK